MRCCRSVGLGRWVSIWAAGPSAGHHDGPRLGACPAHPAAAEPLVTGCHFQGVRDHGDWVLRARGGFGISGVRPPGSVSSWGRSIPKRDVSGLRTPERSGCRRKASTPRCPRAGPQRSGLFLFPSAPDQAPGKPGARQSLGDLGQHLRVSPPHWGPQHTPGSPAGRQQTDLLTGALLRGGRLLMSHVGALGFGVS